MRIKTFTLNTRQEAMVKFTREVLTLYKVEITGPRAETDYDQLSVVHRRLPDQDGLPRLQTIVWLFDAQGNMQRYERDDIGQRDERPRAALHRIAKLNFYRVFVEELGFPSAPWGVLHGVRPTKIVHRWLRAGFTPAQASARLQSVYDCSREKAELIVPMAVRQLPFLAQGKKDMVSIYVGIPFCLTRCLYCSFPANILPGEKQLQHFMQIWQKDLEAAAAAVARYHLRVQNIYIGGGTPTSLPDAVFADMLDRVYNAFYGPDCVEFTVEAGRPDSMSPAKIAAMAAHKVTRVSVNPQTMQERTLHLIGRQHTPEQVVTMYHALREAGIPHINMDLILGLPGETAADVADTMAKVVALGPDDITLHALAIKRGSRLKLIMQEKHVDLPGDAETRRMSEVALHAVHEAGLQPYYLYRQGYMSGDLENIGCARPGAEGMYNIQIMEEHQTIIGIGGAAATKVVDPETMVMPSTFNAKDLTTYLREIDTYIAKRDALSARAYQRTLA